MTENQSDAGGPDAADEVATEEVAAANSAGDADGGLDAFAASLAETVGASRWSTEFGMAKVYVERDRWVEAATAARDTGLDFFSWLSAVDWSREVAVGDAVDAPDDLDERYEVLCRLSTVTDDRGVVLSTDLPKDDPTVDTLVDVFGGASWHEREAHEMFGIEFTGHPHLVKLYLPDAFEGYPLRKSYPLLSREVKPWPGLVDVEDMPSTDNVEADEGGDAESEGGDE